MTLLLALFFACADSNDSTLASGCHRSDECLDGSSCFAPGACNAGMEEQVPVDCTTSDDCSGELVCQTSAAGCGFTAGAACVESCVSAGCGADEACDDTTGLCAPAACADGYTCPEFTACVASGGDDHGCVRDTCVADGDCADGACVDGACFAVLGTCDWAAP